MKFFSHLRTPVSGLLTPMGLGGGSLFVHHLLARAVLVIVLSLILSWLGWSSWGALYWCGFILMTVSIWTSQRPYDPETQFTGQLASVLASAIVLHVSASILAGVLVANLCVLLFVTVAALSVGGNMEQNIRQRTHRPYAPRRSAWFALVSCVLLVLLTPYWPIWHDVQFKIAAGIVLLFYWLALHFAKEPHRRPLASGSAVRHRKRK